MDYKRGQMYGADLARDDCNSHITYGNRPVVIVSNDIGNDRSPVVVVCPLTTRKDRLSHIHPYVHCCRGRSRSYVATEQIRVLDKDRLQEYISTVSPTEQQYIDKALCIVLGLPYLAHEDQDSNLSSVSPEDSHALEVGNAVLNLASLLGMSNVLSDTSVVDEEISSSWEEASVTCEDAKSSRCDSVSNNSTLASDFDVNSIDKSFGTKRKHLSAIDKFNMRYSKCGTYNKSASLSAKDNKWTAEKKSKFIDDFESLGKAKASEKYGVKPSTATAYYYRFKKSESL